MKTVVSLSETEAALAHAEATLKEAKARHMATLPVAPAEVVSEMAAIAAKLEITEAESKRVKTLKESYRFRDEEKDQLAAAKAKRLEVARSQEWRRKFADAVSSGHIMDARRKLRVDGRVVSTIKVLV
jgi:hypothetical protein